MPIDVTCERWIERQTDAPVRHAIRQKKISLPGRKQQHWLTANTCPQDYLYETPPGEPPRSKGGCAAEGEHASPSPSAGLKREQVSRRSAGRAMGNTLLRPRLLGDGHGPARGFYGRAAGARVHL